MTGSSLQPESTDPTNKESLAAPVVSALSSSAIIGQFYKVPVESLEILKQTAREFAPGYEALFLQACDFLNRGLETGHRIFLNQFEPRSKQITESLKWLEGCFEHREPIRSFLRACEISGGLYDAITKKKIEPEFTPQDLKLAYEKFEQEHGEFRSRVMSLSKLQAVLFDPRLAPRLPNARGIYPESINSLSQDGLDEFQARAVDVHDGSSLYTAIEEIPGGGLQAVRFNRLFSSDVKELNSHLQRAAELFSELADKLDGEKAQGLRRFVEYLREHGKNSLELQGRFPYSPSEIALNAAHRGAGAVPFAYYCSFGSSYSDTFSARYFVSGSFGLVTPEGAALRPFIDRMSEINDLERNLPSPSSIRDNVKAVPILILDVVNRSGYSRVGTQGIAVTMAPDEKEVREEHGSVIVCWRNVLNAKTHAILTPIAREVMDPEAIERHRDKFEKLLEIQQIVGVVSHEQRHVLGDQLDSETAKRPDRLGRHFDTINEGLAETGRLYSYREIIPAEGFLGLSSDEVKRFFYDSYVSEMVRHLRGGIESAYGRAAGIRLNYLQQAGAIEVSGDLKIRVIDQDKLESATAELYALHLSLRRTGDASACRKLIEQYSITRGSELDYHINGILRQLHCLQIPRDVCMEYRLIA